MSIIDFTQARKNMIDSQIATMGVTDPDVLLVLSEIPRELFVPEDRQWGAYSDEDLPLNDGGFLMEPLIFARMVQAAMPAKDDAVLSVGDSTGYAAAVLSRLAGRVVALEDRPGRFDRARRAWASLDCSNITLSQGRALAGDPAHGPYDLIFVNGSAASIPDALVSQLAEGGRMLAVIRQTAGKPDGKAVLVTKTQSGNHAAKILFDAATPFVPDLAPKAAFVF